MRAKRKLVSLEHSGPVVAIEPQKSHKKGVAGSTTEGEGESSRAEGEIRAAVTAQRRPGLPVTVQKPILKGCCH